jgi:hypothetical protein
MSTPLNYRDATFLADGRIDCWIEHSQWGWIPFTAAADDEEEHGRDLHARILAAGDVAPYVPPSEEELLAQWRAEAFCTPLQGQLALGEERWLRVEEILSDPSTPWSMKQTIRGASVWMRNSQDIDTLAWMLGLSAEEVDELFRVAVATAT